MSILIPLSSVVTKSWWSRWREWDRSYYLIERPKTAFHIINGNVNKLCANDITGEIVTGAKYWGRLICWTKGNEFRGNEVCARNADSDRVRSRIYCAQAYAMEISCSLPPSACRLQLPISTVTLKKNDDEKRRASECRGVERRVEDCWWWKLCSENWIGFSLLENSTYIFSLFVCACMCVFNPTVSDIILLYETLFMFVTQPLSFHFLPNPRS